MLDIVIGIPVTYVGGLLQMVYVMDITFWQGFIMAALPYIPGDIIKCLGAAWIGVKVNQLLEYRQ